MRQIRIPNKQKGLFSFFISFSGIDKIGGERHFLEHMIFTKTKSMNRSLVSKNSAVLGVQDCFNACTSSSEIMFYGTYLEKDQDKIADILSEILFYPVFTKSEVTKEIETVKEEWSGCDKKDKDFARELKKRDKVDLSIIGTDVSDFNLFTPSLLTSLHRSIFNKTNMFIAVDSNGSLFEHRILYYALSGEYNCFPMYIPKSFSMSHPEAETNETTLVFPILPDRMFRYYKAVKNSMEGDIWLKLREKKQLFYSCSFNNGYSDNLSPLVNLSFSSTKPVDDVVGQLLKHLEVESRRSYENVCKSLEISSFQNKKDMMGFLCNYGKDIYGDLSYKDMCRTDHPSYEEVVEYGKMLKKSNFSVISLLKKE